MSLFTANEKVDMIFIYRECNNNCRKSLELYKEKFPTRNQPSRMIFSRLVDSLRKTGHFPDGKHKLHTRNVTNIPAEENIVTYFIAFPNNSLAKASKDLGIPKTSIHRVLKRQNMFPYKIHIVQHLRVTDYDRRMNFIAWFKVSNHIIIKKKIFH